MLVEYGEKLFKAVLSEMHSDDTDDHSFGVRRVELVLPSIKRIAA
jgi:hypothetical protein